MVSLICFRNSVVVKPELRLPLGSFNTDEMVGHDAALEEPPQGVERAPMSTYSPMRNSKQNGDTNGTARANGQHAPKDKFTATGDSKRMDRLRQFPRKLRRKLTSKENRRSDVHSEQWIAEPTSMAPVLAPEPPENDQQVRFAENEQAGKPILVPLKEFAQKPMESMKSMANKKGGMEFAENMADSDATHGASVQMVLAQEKIATETKTEDRQAAVEDFENHQKVRQDAFVRWTMSRHVQKVKNAQLIRPPYPTKERFVWDDNGKEKMHWLKYVQKVRRSFLALDFVMFETQLYKRVS